MATIELPTTEGTSTGSVVTASGDTVNYTVTLSGTIADGSIFLPGGGIRLGGANLTSENVVMDLDTPVNDLSIIVSGVDQSPFHDDRVIIQAFDADGNPVAISFTNNATYTIYSDGSNGTLDYEADPGGSTPLEIETVTFGPGVARVVLNLTAGASRPPAIIYVSDFTFISVLCMARDTMISTDQGEVAVQDLTPGMMVRTQDNGYQPIRWIGSRRLDRIDLAVKAKLKPIRISAGALGEGLPKSDLVVSPQHRILLRSRIAQRMFKQAEILVAAQQLLAVPGIEIVEDCESVEYWHFMMDRHEIVQANGALAESLLPGIEALKAVPTEALEEIFQIFPELRDREAAKHVEHARYVPAGHKSRKLVERAGATGRPLVEDVWHADTF